MSEASKDCTSSQTEVVDEVEKHQHDCDNAGRNGDADDAPSLNGGGPNSQETDDDTERSQKKQRFAIQTDTDASKVASFQARPQQETHSASGNTLLTSTANFSPLPIQSPQQASLSLPSPMQYAPFLFGTATPLNVAQQQTGLPLPPLYPPIVGTMNPLSIFQAHSVTSGGVLSRQPILPIVAVSNNGFLAQAAYASSAFVLGSHGPVNLATLGNLAAMGGLPQQQQQYAVSLHPPTDRTVTGRQPLTIYMNCDDDSLSEYQCLVRKQIELFEAVQNDVDTNAQGRNRPVVLGQVGIRCCHCSVLPPKSRTKGAVYYPARLAGLYQAAQNMATTHLAELCPHVPYEIRAGLKKLRDRKSSAGGGKKYWADGARVLGVQEDSYGLRFAKVIS